jgi:hypothetical protein
VGLKQRGAGGCLVVELGELGDVAVAPWVVGHRVDDDLAVQLLGRHLRVAAQGS